MSFFADFFVFFFKQKTAYEMRISDWSSDVCSSDLDDAGDRLFDAVQATAILGQRQPRPLDLARAGFATQLCYQFKDLCKPGGPNRMPLGFEATGRINRDTAAQSGFTALGYRPAIAEIAEAKILDLDDFAHRGGVMHPGHRNIVRANAGLFIGALRTERGAMFLDFGGKIGRAHV